MNSDGNFTYNPASGSLTLPSDYLTHYNPQTEENSYFC